MYSNCQYLGNCPKYFFRSAWIQDCMITASCKFKIQINFSLKIIKLLQKLSKTVTSKIYMLTVKYTIKGLLLTQHIYTYQKSLCRSTRVYVSSSDKNLLQLEQQKHSVWNLTSPITCNKVLEMYIFMFNKKNKK